jgi:RNA polymerase sigma-70 factor (ECF subfamily)
LVLAAGAPGAAAAPEDERALALALMGRCEEAVLPAWRALRPFVDRTLHRLLGPDRDREDLIQEVFLRFFRTVPRLRDAAALRPFLFGIVARVVKRELRCRWLRGWSRVSARVEHAPEEPCTGDPLASEAVSRLFRVLAQVAAQDRSLFVARYVEEMELTDVAEAHGLSFSTTRRRLDRAWARVRARALRDPILGSYVGRDGGRHPGSPRDDAAGKRSR